MKGRTRFLLIWLVAILAGFIIGWLLPAVATADVPGPRPNQPHGDQFSAPGFSNLAQFNPLNDRVKARQPVFYRVTVMPGCSAGTIPQALFALEGEAYGKLQQYRIERRDVAPDFTVFINCGSEQIRLCGSVNTFCLPYGFPLNVDVSISDILSTYQPITQLAVLLHEIMGHALATWDEQYCKGNEAVGNICYGLTLFTPAPGWHDFMNTGAESRHGFEAIELERWSRTMFNVLLTCETLGFDPCTGRYFMPDRWSWNPANGDWHNPFGEPEFSACNQDGLRWAYRIERWAVPASNFFDPVKGYWARAPEC